MRMFLEKKSQMQLFGKFPSIHNDWKTCQTIVFIHLKHFLGMLMGIGTLVLQGLGTLWHLMSNFRVGPKKQKKDKKA